MKKILLLLLIIFYTFSSYAQTIVNRAGPANTVADYRLQATYNFFVPRYADTATANTYKGIDSCGALIFTYDSNKVWYRQCSPKRWVIFGSVSGGGTNIYNSDGIISGTRIVELSTYPLSFIRNTYKQLALEDDLSTIGSPNNIRRFTIYDDSIVLIGSDQSASSADSVLVRTADGRIKTRAQSAIAGATPTLQQVLTAGSVLTVNNDIDLNSTDLTFINTGGAGTFYVNIEGGVIGLEANVAGDANTGFELNKDSIIYHPHKGRINIDTLRSWSGISDTTYKKVMTWDTRNGRWEYSNWFGSGGGGGVTSIGTINSQTKAANGAVITGTSLVMQTVDATYPGLMTSADKLRLDSTSYLSIDKTFDSLAWGRNDSVFLVKSLRVQVNGSTITPTTTDSTLSYNLTSLSLFPVTGTGTATGAVTGALGTNQLLVTSTAYPTGLFLIQNSNGRVVIGDHGPDVNNTYISLNDNTKSISLLSDRYISINTSDSLLLDAVSIRFRTLSNFADTTDWKAVVINNTTGEIRRATYWPGSGGSGWGLSGNSITAGVGIIGTTNNTSMRFYTNNTLRMQLDSNGNLYQGSGNPIYGNVKFHQRYSGTSSDYYWFADDPFNTLIHYMRGDGEAWHTGGISIAASKFTVNGSTGATSIKGAVTINDDGGDLDTRIEGDTDANLFFTDASTDRVGIGTNTPAAQFHTTSSVRLAGIGGAGAVQSDADGDLSVTSDGRLKFIDSQLKFGLKEILKIDPVIYRWKHKPNGAQYAGFDALQVYDIMGELAAPTNKDGFHSLQDRALIGALINSVKEQQVMIEKLQKEVNKLKKR